MRTEASFVKMITESISEIFSRTGKFLPTKEHGDFFLLFSNFVFHGEKNHSIVLLANEIGEWNQLKNKTNTVKYRSEKTICRVAIN